MFFVGIFSAFFSSMGLYSFIKYDSTMGACTSLFMALFSLGVFIQAAADQLDTASKKAKR